MRHSLEHGHGIGLDEGIRRRVVEFRPGIERHGRELLSRGACLVIIEQLDEIGGGRGGGHADKFQIGSVACGKLTGIERGMTALAVAPHHEAIGRTERGKARAARTESSTARPSLTPIR